MSGALAVVGGNGLLGSGFGADAPELTVDDGTKSVMVRDLGDAYFLQRHGFGGYTPPHLVDHVANMRALVALGCDRVLALNSTGALHDGVHAGFVPPGRGLHRAGSAAEHVHRRARPPRADASTAPGGSEVLDAWRVVDHGAVARRWRVLAGDRSSAGDGGGDPGVRAARRRGRVHHGVGVRGRAGELGLAYASVCVVDNLANGVGEHPLTWSEFETGRDATQHDLEKVARGARSRAGSVGALHLVELERDRVLAAHGVAGGAGVARGGTRRDRSRCPARRCTPRARAGWRCRSRWRRPRRRSASAWAHRPSPPGAHRSTGRRRR